MLKEQVYKTTEDGNSRSGEFKIASWKEFAPFLRWENRKEWEQLSDTLEKIILDAAKPYADIEYPVLKTTDLMECYRSGNRTACKTPYFTRRNAPNAPVLTYCLEPGASGLNQIINGVQCICEGSTWAVPAHNFIYEPGAINGERTLPDVELPVVDTFTGETGMLLSMTYYLLKGELDRVEPLVARRLQREVRGWVVKPFLTRYSYWWVGCSDRRDINSRGPWCVMNCAINTLFCETKDDRRKRVVIRTMDVIGHYLKGIGQGGGCDESTTYWGRARGMLLKDVNLIYEATGGTVTAYGEKKLADFADYIRRMYIGGDYVVNFADGLTKYNPAAEIIYTTGCRMKNLRLGDFGAYCYRKQLKEGIFLTLSPSRAMASIQKHKEMRHIAGEAIFELKDYIDGLEIMAVRQYGNVGRGLFLYAEGGNSDDSHNHNDMGNFICCGDGSPILIDVGVETYNRESFGPGRYQIRIMQPQFHNLPTIGGVIQRGGTEYRVKNVGHVSGAAHSALPCDIQGACPSLKGGVYYRRCAELSREEGLVVLTEKLDVPEVTGIEFHYMIPCRITVGCGRIRLLPNTGDIIMKFNTSRFDIQTESITLTDKKLIDNWGSCICRLTLKCTAEKEEFVFGISKA